MKNLILAIVVFFALLGLAVVQYHFLRVAIKLEKVRFDKEARLMLQKVARQLDRSPALRRQVVQLRSFGKRPRQEEAFRLSQAVADSVARLIDWELQAEGLSLDYAFAIKEGLLLYPLLSQNGFKSEEEESYRTYSRSLKGKLREACNCELFFYLQANNLFPFLMKRLYRLVLPSAVFLLLLLAALFLMMRMLTQLRTLDQVKNDFINNLTHELKTPAFSTSLLLKLLRQSIGTGDRGRSEEYLGLLESENEQLKGHIDKVLELASMETGRYAMQRRELQLHPFLEKVIQQYRYKAEGQGGTLAFAPAATRSRLIADERHLRSAIQNLLDNALLYGGPNPQVAVSTQNQRGSILIAVTDKGPGIPPGQQQRLFRKFYRIPSGDIHKAKGFGLGLSFTRQIARAHGGEVRVDSKVGQGSTFTVVLPITTTKS